MPIKLDLHVHTESRGKTLIDDKKLSLAIKKNRIDGVAVTNFFDISHAQWLKKKADNCIIIVGQEIWAKEGHIIGLGLKERVPDFLSAEDTIKLIHDQNGFAVAPHPFLHLGVGKNAETLPVDAVEVYSGLVGAAVIFNHLANRLAKKCNIPRIVSTDTTDPKFIGRSYTKVLTDNAEDIFKSIQAGKVKLKRRAVPLPVMFILKNLLNFTNFEPYSAHAVPCYICGKSMAVRINKKRYACFDCGKEVKSRIVCCNGHYLCLDCIIKRGYLLVQEKHVKGLSPESLIGERDVI